MKFFVSMFSEENGQISSNRVTVLLLAIAGIFVAVKQKDITMASMLLGFAFGNKQVGKVLENKKDKEV